MLRINVFRAIDDIDSCKRYSIGHESVLESYNIPKITSANTDWFYDDGVYVIMVEDLITNEVVGGAKLHITNGDTSLPIEGAIGPLDKKIHGVIKSKIITNVGEVCGLWNTRKVSGSGLGVLLVRSGVAKAGVVLAKQLNINALFGLCAPWTVGIVKSMGFSVLKSVGNKGTFHYPKPDLIATVVSLEDTMSLDYANPTERTSIFNLREIPQQIRLESGPKGSFEIEYDLLLSTQMELAY